MVPQSFTSLIDVASQLAWQVTLTLMHVLWVEPRSLFWQQSQTTFLLNTKVPERIQVPSREVPESVTS